MGARPDRGLVTAVVGRFEPLVHRGLTQGLREDDQVRVLASDLKVAALERVVAEQAPRVAILNETVDHSLLVRLKSSQPTTGVLILADDPPRLYRTLMLAVGARWLARSASTADVLAAVHLAAEGETALLAADGQRVQPRSLSKEHSLTPRERKVLEQLSKGRSYGEIALALHIGPETVRTHTVRICRKLKVRSKRDLIGWGGPSIPDRDTG
jgi:DNA-binding NarL/FixJ family response regulator